MKVISFCLWGDKLIYTVGIVENVKLAQKFYKDWQCWIYIHKNVDKTLIKTLEAYPNVKIIIKDEETIRTRRFMLWRLEPLDDENVTYLISRDADSRISIKEVLAVKEWVESGKTLHIMRDHPQHYPKILGGMFGLKKGVIVEKFWHKLVDEFYTQNSECTDDQNFLEQYLYKYDKYIHDEIKRYEGDECNDFPIEYELNYHFIGCYINPDNFTDFQTSNVLKTWLNKYKPHRISNAITCLEDKLNFIKRNINTIYILHYTKLIERKKHMMSQKVYKILSLYFNIVWVENFDRETLTKEQINENYIYNPNLCRRPLTMAEIANGIAHLDILRSVKDTCLIIEDDTVFKDNFISGLFILLFNLPQKWNAISLGGPTQDMDYPSKTEPGATDKKFDINKIHLIKPVIPAAATMSCFLINEEACKIILNSSFVKPFSAPIDDTVLHIGLSIGFNWHWCQPWISYEGSKDSLFLTSLERGF